MRGQVFIVVLILVTAAAALNIVFFNYVADEIKISGREIRETQVVNLAEAGIDKALYELNKNSSWATSGEIVLGGGSFEVAATSTGVLSNQKVIESIGYIPNKTSVVTKKKIRVIAYISGEQFGFKYAAQSGNGGLYMDNNTTLKGNIHTNGSIECKNTNNQITGDASAVETISADCNVAGTETPNATSTDMPEFNAAFWREEAAKGGVINEDYTVTGGSFGPKRINGNLTFNAPTITITGVIYATGSFLIAAATDIYLDQSFGSNGTVILADGGVTINPNINIYPTSATPKGYIQITNTSSTAPIDVKSNATGSVFYAVNGDVIISGNSYPVSLSAGNKIILNANAMLNYDMGLQSQYFTSGPGAGWMVKKGTWRVIKEN